MVSVSTVTRIVTGLVAVEPATAEPVREATARLGDRSNLLARPLRRHVTRTIGSPALESSTPYFPELARTLENALCTEGYGVVLCNPGHSPVSPATALDVVLSSRVDGPILATLGKTVCQ